jgi:hypothetical protein
MTWILQPCCLLSILIKHGNHREGETYVFYTEREREERMSVDEKKWGGKE